MKSSPSKITDSQITGHHKHRPTKPGQSESASAAPGSSAKPRIANTRKLYDLPRYYDAAFAGDPAHEAMIIERAIADHSPHPVRRILEPACGSARLLIALALYGYRLTGYDNSAAMVRFARQRIASMGMSRRVNVVQADMTTATFKSKFDAAFNLISSIGHLLTDDDVITHLRRTAASLRPHSIYIVELPPLYRPGSVAEPNRWRVQTDDLRIDTDWRVISDDISARLSHQRCTMRIRDKMSAPKPGQSESSSAAPGSDLRIIHTENITVRLWLANDWRKLITRAGCFEHAALIRSRNRSFHILRRV